MTEDEMYDIIRGYDDSERDYHERNIKLESENARFREENAELVELVRRIWNVARLMQANEHITGMRITDEFRSWCEAKFTKLGIDVDGHLETMEGDE